MTAAMMIDPANQRDQIAQTGLNMLFFYDLENSASLEGAGSRHECTGPEPASSSRWGDWKGKTATNAGFHG
jgi:hypothetical protein